MIAFSLIVIFMFQNPSNATASKLTYEIEFSLPDSNEKVELLSSDKVCTLSTSSVSVKKLPLKICISISRQFPHIIDGLFEREIVDRQVNNVDFVIRKNGEMFPAVVSIDQRSTCDPAGTCTEAKPSELQKLIFLLMDLAGKKR